MNHEKIIASELIFEAAFPQLITEFNDDSNFSFDPNSNLVRVSDSYKEYVMDKKEETFKEYLENAALQNLLKVDH